MEKKLEQTLEEIRKKYPGSQVEIWAMDEHRLGLKPILRRVWVRMGEQPIANVYWRYQWLWLYGFVHPESGETYYWILPRVNVELFNQVLADFAREFQLGSDKHIVLTLDRAGWHTSKDLEIPLGLHLEYMQTPTHPNYNSSVRLWPLVNEAIANRSFDKLEDERGSFIPALSSPFRTAVSHQGYYPLPLVARNSVLITPMLPDLISIYPRSTPPSRLVHPSMVRLQCSSLRYHHTVINI